MSRPHQFDRLREEAQAEIERDAPELARRLELTADAADTSEEDYVAQVRDHWADPQWRQNLARRENPERFVSLALKAQGVPLTVQQYHAMVLKPLSEGQPMGQGGSQRDEIARSVMDNFPFK